MNKQFIKKILKRILLGLLIIILLLSIDILYELYGYRIKYYNEIKFTRLFWEEIINNDRPTKYFYDSLDKEGKNDNYIDGVFYGFRILFITMSPDEHTSKLLKLDSAIKMGNNRYGIVFKYNNYNFFNTLSIENGELKAFPWMNLGCDPNIFKPDFNHDGIIDYEDVDFAIKNNIKFTDEGLW